MIANSKKFGNKHATIIMLDNGNIVLVSYSTPVAVLSGNTLYTTTQRYSVTTSKQTSQFIGELLGSGTTWETSQQVPQSQIDQLSQRSELGYMFA